MSEKKKVIRKRHDLPVGHLNFKIYMSRVLKQVHPDVSLAAPAADELNSIINHLGNEIARLAAQTARKNDRKTITSRDVQAGVRLLIPGELAKHAVSEGLKASTKYNKARRIKNEMSGSVHDQRPTARAGLVFDIARTRRFLNKYKFRIGEMAPIYFAAVIEYITAEILELAGNVTRDRKKRRVSVQSLHLAIQGDSELHCLIETRLKIYLAGSVKGYDKKKFARKRKGGAKEIRENAGSNKYLFPKEPFSRLAREITQRTFDNDYRFTKDAMLILHLETERYLVDLLEKANMNAIHAKRITLMPKDIQLVLRNCRTTC